MSTVVRATCPDCGDVRLTVEGVVLRFLAETAFEQAQYRFICPECHKIVVKPADHTVATLLYSSGVAVERFELPLELLQRPKEDEGDVISLDDVLDLCLALEEDEESWFKKLTRKVKGEDGSV